MSIDAYLALHRYLQPRLHHRVFYAVMTVPSWLLLARTWVRWYFDRRPWC